MISNEPSKSISYIDVAEYEWKPDKICEVYAGITCEKLDGKPID